MRQKRFLILLPVMALFMGCGGGTLGNLIPLPKLLKGNVKDDIYTSPDNKFQIQIPHPTKRGSADDYEWTYTKVAEGQEGSLTYVVFGPAALDLNRYHAVVVKNIKKIDKPTREQADFTIDKYIQNAESKTGQKFKNLRSDNITINGTDAVYKVYGSSSAYLVFSYLDYKTYTASIIAEVNRSNGIKSAAPTEKELIERTWALYSTFEGSLKILAQ